jgi:predicted nucleic acid-binding protein
MNARTFIDSNVFIYAIQSSDVSKAERAALWLVHLAKSGAGVANLQVLNEVTNVLIRRGLMKPEEIFTVIDTYRAFGTEPVTMEIVAAARLIHFEAGYSWWDCILLASAIERRCGFFLTEDLQHGHRLYGLTIVNPFLHSPPQPPFH